MKRFLLLIIFAVSVAGCGNDKPSAKKDSVKPPKVPVKVDSVRKNLQVPVRMSSVRKTAFDIYRVRIGDVEYTCTYKGKVERSDTLGNNPELLFDLKAEYLVDLVYLLPLESDHFFIAWQETDHQGVHSKFAVFNKEKTRPEWLIDKKAPSPGQPLVDSASAYVSCLGMVARLNLENGNVIWMHDSLFDPTRLVFKKFQRPLVYPHTVCFYDLPIQGKKPKSDSIWMDNRTGRIVR